MFNIPNILYAFDRIKQSSIKFDRAVCVRYRDKKAGCSRCADICPVGAIDWGRSEVFDAYACTSCGLCSAVCPVSALTILDYQHSILHRELIDAISHGADSSFTGGEKSFLISCHKDNDNYAEKIFNPSLIAGHGAGIKSVARNGEPNSDDRSDSNGDNDPSTTSIKVKCLGALTAYDLFELMHRTSGDVFFGTSVCAECDYKKGYERMAGELEEILKIGSALNIGQRFSLKILGKNDAERPFVRLTAVNEPAVKTVKEQSGMSRRDFFTGLKQEAAKNAGRVVTDAVISISEEKLKAVRYVNKVPDDKTLLIQKISSAWSDLQKAQGPIEGEQVGSVRSLKESESIVCDALFRLGTKKVSANSNCDLCLTCAELCPTSTFEFSYTKDQKENTLKAIAANCVGCLLCKEICPKEAIRFERIEFLSELYEVKIVRSE